jgi:hypothetical protein
VGGSRLQRRTLLQRASVSTQLRHKQRALALQRC